MQLITLDKLKPKRKKVLLRVDFNVVSAGKVIDEFRIRAAVPTIRHLLKQKCSLILISHNGRPEGRRLKNLSLRPAAQALADILRRPVHFLPDCVGDGVSTAAAKLKPGDILMLENLRFHREEERGDDKFARALASLADVYVDDAFAAVHRAHSSITGVPRYLPHAAGLLVASEYKNLHSLLEKPKRPYTAIIGGAKVSDKLEILESLIRRVDTLVIGGAMANTFLLSQGMLMGASVMERSMTKTCQSLLRRAKRAGVEVILPDDLVIARGPQAKIPTQVIEVGQMPPGQMALDLGPKTADMIMKVVDRSRTVFWNGTLGYAELEQFSHASEEVARAIAGSRARSIIGGGDTASFIDHLGMHKDFDFVSTGGGASLELVSGRDLPGLAALSK